MRAAGIYLTVFFLALTCFRAAPAGAQDLLQQEKELLPPRQLSILYYERCLEDTYTDLPDDVREGYCACTADKANANLTPDELITMAYGEGPVIPQDVLTVHIQAPCLAEPFFYLEYENCMTHRKYQQMFSSRDVLKKNCDCMAERAEYFMKEYAADLIAYTQIRYPVYSDPVAGLRESPEYQKERDGWRRTCMRAYAFQQ